MTSLPAEHTMAATVHQPPEHVVKGAHVDSLAKYKDMYARSLSDPEVRGAAGPRRAGPLTSAEPSLTHRPCWPPLQGFWGEFASQFHWNKKWTSGADFHK